MGELARGSYLDDEEAIERAAIFLFVDEIAHFPDDPRSRSAARRRWDSHGEGTVRDSWRRKARQVVAALEGERNA